MIEINLNNLQKGERIVDVKAHSTKSGYVQAHKRKIKTAAEHDVEMEDRFTSLKIYKDAASKTENWINNNPDRYADVGEVNNYCVDDYNVINETLREGLSEKQLSEMDLSQQIYSISSFLKDAPKFTGTTYRGMTFGGDKAGKESLKKFMFNINSIGGFVMLPFASTSVDKYVATGFASTQGGSTSVVLEIKSKNGVALDGAAEFTREQEVLFDRNSQFKVIDVKTEGHNMHIKLEEV